MQQATTLPAIRNPSSPGQDSPWHDIMPLADLADAAPRRMQVGDRSFLVVRQGEQVRAFAATCPHKGAPLEQGTLCAGKLVCPWHKAVFDLNDGGLIEPLALDPLPRYPTRLVDGRIQIQPVALPLPAPVPTGADQGVVIVGAGAAGVTAAVSLREFGFAGRITLIGDETAPPYDRTALTKTVLAEKEEGNRAPPLRPAGFYETHGIDRVVARVTAFDPASRTVELSDGRKLTGDHVVLAPGAAPRMLDVPGHDLPDVFTLRSQADAQAILATRNITDRHVVVCGGSFIGMEAAASLSQAGAKVTVVSATAVPFEKALGHEIGLRLRRLHQEKGVTYIGGHRVTAIAERGGKRQVTLDNGRILLADMVVAGLGVRPATGFVPALATAPDGGIDVDGAMQAAPHVYAAGDIARFVHQGRRMRIEHWRTAQIHGRVAARAIMKQPGRFEEIPWFWTLQFGRKLEYVGYQEPFDRVTIDGDLDAFNFMATQWNGARRVGVITAGRPRETGELVLRRTL